MTSKTSTSKYADRLMASLSEQDRVLIKKFINQFKLTHTYKDLELRVSAREVRAFLLSNQSSLSFTKFNRITGCSGITSYNLYSYSLPLLYTLVSKSKEKRLNKKYPTDWIFTINCYGAKKDFREEWSYLLKYVVSDLNCHSLIDAFAGSGFISLLAAKLGLFSFILQNDASTELYNFYCVMKEEKQFDKFIKIISKLPEPSIEAFNLMREKFYYIDRSCDERRSKEIAGREIKRQLQTVDAKRAAMLFWLKHYSAYGAGGLSTEKFELFNYIEDLKRTHSLYKDIVLKNRLYNNVIRDQLNNERCLIVLDAPYLEDVRVQKESYTIEFNTLKEHLTMLNMIKNASAKIIICGYRDEADTYTNFLKTHSMQTWHCIMLKKVSRKSSKKEHIWINFDANNLVVENKYFEKI